MCDRIIMLLADKGNHSFAGCLENIVEAARRTVSTVNLVILFRHLHGPGGGVRCEHRSKEQGGDCNAKSCRRIHGAIQLHLWWAPPVEIRYLLKLHPDR